ncbi:MAG: SRPBCC domain-containing protein [Anaerolineales bacterium]
MESFTISSILPATPDQIYTAWLSSEGHSQMTGSPAEVDGGSGGAFKAWDGYIWGVTLEMEPNHRILQAWRTSEFSEDSPHSRVEILLEEVADGTKITLIHTEIPEGQSEGFKQGWEDFYFTPMRAYFSK